MVTKKLRLACVLALAGSVLVSLRCGEDKGPGPQPHLVVIPDSPSIEISSSQAFEVDFDGQTPGVTWYVNGIQGGDPWTGMITTEGVYVAPDSVPSLDGFAPGSVMLEAVAVEDATVRGEAAILITRTDTTAFVTVAPDTATVLVGDSLEFSSDVSGCESTDVVWSIAVVAGDPDSIGMIRANGTYVAPPALGATFDLMVRATSEGRPDKSGVAKVLVAGVAKPFDVELEDYTGYLNLGARPIAVAYCGAASKDHAVEGLDLSGEYVEVPMRVPGTGTYVASVWYSAGSGTSIEVQVTVTDAGPSPQEADFVLDEGTGIG
jgi:hypothetical protein